MSDDLNDRDTSAVRARWAFTVDLRDVVFVVGGILVVIAAAAVHWAACVGVVGLGLCLLARHLAR